MNNLLFHCPALTFCENRFSYSRAVLLNSLPYDLWQAESLDDLFINLTLYLVRIRYRILYFSVLPCICMYPYSNELCSFTINYAD